MLDNMKPYSVLDSLFSYLAVLFHNIIDILIGESCLELGQKKHKNVLRYVYLVRMLLILLSSIFGQMISLSFEIFAMYRLLQFLKRIHNWH